MHRFIPIIILFTILLLAVCLTQTNHKRIADPDPGRFQSEIDQFSYWDQKNSWPDNAVLFVGSSSIRMWLTQDAFPEYPIINRGFGGAHISDVDHYYDQVIKSYDPRAIVFYTGDNDVAAGKPVQQVFKDYMNLVNRIRGDFPDIQFIYIPIKPSGSRWKYWEDMSEVNQLIREFNQGIDGFYYVDLAAVLMSPDGKPDDSLFLDDRLHLNDAGYTRWNSKLAPFFKRIITQD